jgi:hypothetical protein
MLALAAEELRKQVKEFQPAKLPPTVRRRPNVKTSKTPQPSFDDVHLRVYDLSSSNEPVLVLTATAHPPQSGSETAKSGDYYVTLAARSDIYNELRKLFSSITDSQHLDVNPRLEVIDAVDADGDGRGDLLFRQTGESGSAYTIYRVLPDRFWALYEGTPQ